MRHLFFWRQLTIVPYEGGNADVIRQELGCDVQRRKRPNDLHGLEADRDDTLEQFQRIGWVTTGRLDCIAIGVVDDDTGLVGLYALALHHPFERRLAVDHVVIGLQRDTGLLMLALRGLQEIHFRDNFPVENGRGGNLDGTGGAGIAP